LRVAPHGVFNIHPSLLPRHRGAAPVQGAILAGDSETGVTVMRMDAGLDTGPILSQRSMSIGSKESAEGLESRLAVAGAELLVEALEQLERGPLVPRPQDESLATMTRPLRRSDGKIDWQKTAEEIYRLWRGLHPWPGIHTIVGGETLKVLRCSISDDDCTGPPGRACVSQGRLIVATGGGCVEIPLIQPEGGKAMSGGEFAIGHGAAMDADWGT
ncbi:MAG: methionyl-tRNA formyltransferase, partial [Candidatus Hydrogenedentes bacterium]|nr:methionyl-tRNA formyltransferase [Candidatus Hydrogenedentota bacterium]